jgi:hypothetical protein
MVTSQVLKDAASRWYINQIENPYSSQRWMFEDIICELFQHFIHGSSMQKALDAYNHVRYTYKDWVQNYHLELKQKSKLLIIEPDEYSFRTRFIDRLPLDIQETLIKCEYIMAEHNVNFRCYSMRVTQGATGCDGQIDGLQTSMLHDFMYQIRKV